MIDFLTNVMTTTIYLAGIGGLLLSIPTIIFLYMASKRKDNKEYHAQNIFLAVMATAVVGGFFFNMI